uniref:Uncharacterized protein n=1 Tax=Pristionchus pacificus TaxID=54126 RepID=A0A2A6BF25_PRIPA|eukprot:PDM64411.1 hypothetical protein PRIPAC_52667 [Pristionchus pacificus]
MLPTTARKAENINLTPSSVGLPFFLLSSPLSLSGGREPDRRSASGLDVDGPLPAVSTQRDSCMDLPIVDLDRTHGDILMDFRRQLRLQLLQPSDQ